MACVVLLVSASLRKEKRSSATQAERESSTPDTLGTFNARKRRPSAHTLQQESNFSCPWHNSTVGWEEKDVFNPAAVVKGVS
jgi:hypothetical protein